MSLCVACVLLVSGALGSAAVPGPCTFAVEAMEWSACVMPPIECPNGSFTGVEECAAGESSPGCPPRRTMQGWATGMDTGKREVAHSCGSRYSAVFARCQCSGNLFGFCLGPCRPVGGMVRVMPCPGSFSTVQACRRPAVVR
jgi:hypothetical protein